VAPVRVSQPNPALSGWQSSLRDALGRDFYAWQAGRSPGAFLAALLAAFLYGMLHALGPGHRKTVVFSIFVARDAPWWEPALTGTALAVLHAGASIALMLALRGAVGAMSAKTGVAAIWMEGSAYTLLLLMSVFLLARSIAGVISIKKPAENRAMEMGTLLLTGIYPCPGAILVLSLSLGLGLLGLGVLAVVSMSLGMSVPIVASAYLAWAGRLGLFSWAKRNKAGLGRLSAIMEIAGFLVLLAFSVFIDLLFILSLPRLL
jgi:ABC-type nickel/cobalt efflux system permease component RcnA